MKKTRVAAIVAVAVALSSLSGGALAKSDPDRNDCRGSGGIVQLILQALGFDNQRRFCCVPNKLTEKPAPGCCAKNADCVP